MFNVGHLPVGIVFKSVDGLVIHEKELFDHESMPWNTLSYTHFLELKIPIALDLNDNELGSVGVFLDLSTRNVIEMELKKSVNWTSDSDRLKKAFLNNISHEFRTPMNAIVGYSELLKDKDLDHGLRSDFVDIVIENSLILLNVVDHCLSMASIEAGLVKLKSTMVDLNGLCYTIWNDFLTSSGAADISFEFIPDLTGTSSMINVDVEKLKSILTNLIRNAYDFTESGRICFGYAVKSDCIEFFVEDTGKGISEESLTTIFDEFSKVDYALKNRGIGLGLTICRSYVTLMGGSIWVKSTIGVGSIFYFSIPLTLDSSHRSIGNNC